MNNQLEVEKTTKKCWGCIKNIYAAFAVLAFIIYLVFKIFGIVLSLRTFHTLELTNVHKKQIISLLDKENIDYCESMYKIEYIELFPDDYSMTIYCKSEDNIKKDMPDFPTSELIMYIRTNGITTKRKYN